MRQMMGYYKKSKGYNKIQCKGRTDAFRGSLRYQNWLEIINKKSNNGTITKTKNTTDCRGYYCCLCCTKKP